MPATSCIQTFRPIILSFLAIFGFASQANGAAAPIEEIGTNSAGSAVASAQTEKLYYELQVLQQELRELRGMLEAQGNQIELLKKRQQQDYLDLDQRLSALATAPTGNRPIDRYDDPENPSTSAGSGQTNTSSGATSEAAAAYDQAYDLIKARKIDEARTALRKFLDSYPTGPYSANAQYWLGEVYMLRNELPEAESAFRAVITQYPAHRKANDAAFKLGKVLHLRKKPAEAKAILEKVAGTSGSAAKLAQDYLARHF